MVNGMLHGLGGKKVNAFSAPLIKLGVGFEPSFLLSLVV
jgi:hypothetical protein